MSERLRLLRSANPNPVGAAKVDMKEPSRNTRFFCYLMPILALELAYLLVTLRELNRKLFFIGIAVRHIYCRPAT